jgi:hypothetical protein
MSLGRGAREGKIKGRLPLTKIQPRFLVFSYKVMWWRPPRFPLKG